MSMNTVKKHYVKFHFNEDDYGYGVNHEYSKPKLIINCNEAYIDEIKYLIDSFDVTVARIILEAIMAMKTVYDNFTFTPGKDISVKHDVSIATDSTDINYKRIIISAEDQYNFEVSWEDKEDA